MDLGNWRELDLLKCRIDSIKFSELAKKFKRYYMVDKDRLKIMVMNLGITIFDDDIEIFYVVTQEIYETAKRSVNNGRRDNDRIEPDASMLFGASPALGITAELCKQKFERMIQEHNGQ